MQLLPLVVGSPQLSFPPETSLTVAFTFPRPVRRVHCLLQAFDVGYPEGDHHLAAVQVATFVEFDELASALQGRVRVDFVWRDDSSGFGSAYGATLFARLLLVGE